MVASPQSEDSIRETSVSASDQPTLSRGQFIGITTSKGPHRDSLLVNHINTHEAFRNFLLETNLLTGLPFAMAHDLPHRREGGSETLEQGDLPQRPQRTQTLVSSILRTPRLKLHRNLISSPLEGTSKGVTRDIN